VLTPTPSLRSFSRGFLMGKRQKKLFNGQDSTLQKKTLFEIGAPKTKDDVHSKYYKEIDASFSGTGSSQSSYPTRSDQKTKYKLMTHDTPDTKTISINLNDINRIDIENEDTFHRVPYLEHNLDLIVKNPGIYPMSEMAKVQPDRGEFLRTIMDPSEIDMDRIPPYTPPSEDKLLRKFARESKVKYVMSTSTISSA
jgi:hypothetical protein